MSKFHSTDYPGIYYRDSQAGKRYYVDFVDGLGKRRREVVEGGLKEAKARKGALDSSPTPTPGKTKTTFADYAQAWLDGREARYAPGTVKVYGDHLRLHIFPVIGRKKLHALTKHDVLRVVQAAEAKGMAGTTVHDVIKVMGLVFKSAAWDFGIPNPVRDLTTDHKPPREGRNKTQILSEQELRDLIEVSEKMKTEWVTLSILLGVRSGVRISEVLALRWRDFTLAGDIPSVTVCDQLASRGGETVGHLKGKPVGFSRTIELPRDLAQRLRYFRLASRASADDDFIFARKPGGPPPIQPTLTEAFNLRRDKAYIAADLPSAQRPSFHALRHTFASILIAGAATPPEVAEALGHTKKNGEPNPAVTLDTYAHVWKAQSRRGKLRDILEAASG